MPFVDVGGMFFAIAGVTLVGIVLIAILMVGVIVWGIRRVAPAPRDAAELELRDRLARGEIDMAEFQARLDTLRERAKA
jgi:uncharacterized membrane protein